MAAKPILSEKKRDEYYEVFKKLDSDGNGWLSREEVAQWLRGASKLNISDFRIEKIFRMLDTNQDGKVTLDEFYIAMEKIHRPDDSAAQLRREFESLDSDRDGQLSVEEIQTGLTNCGYSVAREHVRSIITNLDNTANDGGRGRERNISIEEFINIFQ